MTKAESWFEVDKVGLSTKADRVQALVEVALSNTFDQAVKVVDVTLAKSGGGYYSFQVSDDDPEGFKDLTHAYTLFAPSEKVDAPEKRGRFNLGEKLLLSLCRAAEIHTTTGTVVFHPDGRRTVSKRNQDRLGTTVEAHLKLSKQEADDFAEVLKSVVVPEHIRLIFNGEDVKHRVPVKSFEVTLPTVIGADLRPSRRKTTVSLYEPAGWEGARIFELGIPVVGIDVPWDVDVAQKVPLTLARDAVKEQFAGELKEAVLANAHDLLTGEAMKESWVTDSLAEQSPEVIQHVVRERFGDKAVVADASDPEATKKAHDAGYTVVHGGALPKASWQAVKASGALVPAGQVPLLKSGLPVEADGKPPVPEDKWTPAQGIVVDYARKVGMFLLGYEPRVKIANHTAFEGGKVGHTEAWFNRGGRELTLNRGVLRKGWWTGDQEAIDALLIHEFAHNSISDHLSDAFSDECCRLGAKLRRCDVKLPERMV